MDADAGAMDADTGDDAATIPGPPAGELGAFNFTIHDRSPEDQIAVLETYGYKGIAVHSATGALVRRYLRHPSVEGGRFKLHAALYAPNGPIDEVLLGDLLDAMAGREVPLWLTIWTQRGDAAVAFARQAADMAKPRGVTVVLYPHDGLALSSAEAAIEIIEAAGRDNLRVALHLSHELKAGNRDRLAEVVARAAPYLASVTVNGAYTTDGLPTGNFDRVIMPLYEGDLDVQERWVRPIVAAGYRGPFVLHTWMMKDPVDTHLPGSMARWQAMARAVGLR